MYTENKHKCELFVSLRLEASSSKNMLQLFEKSFKMRIKQRSYFRKQTFATLQHTILPFTRMMKLKLNSFRERP